MMCPINSAAKNDSVSISPPCSGCSPVLQEIGVAGDHLDDRLPVPIQRSELIPDVTPDELLFVVVVQFIPVPRERLIEVGVARHPHYFQGWASGHRLSFRMI